jgi:8-oxo-dGTP pyrophosphatase MutT (NUDIX family)
VSGPLHQDAVRVLSAWSPPAGDARQQELREEYLRHLAERPEGMWRHEEAAHLTASALVVDPVRARVLLTLHRKLGMWLQTGGHCEPGDETLGGAALREATEESGIAGLVLVGDGPAVLDRHLVPCHGRAVPPSAHLDVQYVAVAPAGAEPQISEESADLRWFEADALPEGTDRSVRELVRRASELLALAQG